MKSLRFSLAIIFAAGLSANAQTTATTDPVGFSTISPAGGTTTIVPGFVKAATYQGPSTVTGNKLSGDFTPGSMGPTTFADAPNFPTYYAQVTSSGTYQGYVFDVDSVDAQGDIVSSDIPGGLNGQSVTIVVRPHVTLTDLSNSSSGLAAYTDSATIFNPSLQNGSVTCFYVGGDVAGGWSADDFSTRMGQIPVYPGTGFVFNGTGAATFTTTGSVQTSPVAVPLYAGAVNIVGPQQPSSADKINNLNLVSTLGGSGAYTDNYSTFSTDGSMSFTGTYYSDDSAVLDQDFNPLPPNSPASTPLNGGASVTVASSKMWLVPPPTIAP